MAVVGGPLPMLAQQECSAYPENFHNKLSPPRSASGRRAAYDIRGFDRRAQRDGYSDSNCLVFLAFFFVFAGLGMFAEHFAVGIELVAPFFAVLTHDRFVS